MAIDMSKSKLATPQKHPAAINQFYTQTLNPYLNFPVASCLLPFISDYDTGPVIITQIDCQAMNTTCHAHYSGPAVEPPGYDTAQMR
jgi:hypothetical protein